VGVELRIDDVSWRVVEGEIVLLDLRTSTYLTFNGTATDLWVALCDGATVEALPGLLVEKYDISTDEAARDVEDFISDLQSRDLVV
jgi:hypothetical protein